MIVNVIYKFNDNQHKCMNIFQFFQILEHPYEKEFLQTLQTLVLAERLNFKNLIYNLTSNLTEEDLDMLYNYANREEQYGNESDEYGDLKV